MMVALRSVVGLVSVLVGAATHTALAQTLADAQAVHTRPLERVSSLVVHDVPLGVALGQLSATSGVVVAYSPSLVSKTDRTVSCPCASLTVGKVLDRLLRSTGFTYAEIRGQVAVFLLKVPDAPHPAIDRTPLTQGVKLASGRQRQEWLDPRILESIPLPADSLSGVVVDAATGQPVDGAQVVVEGQRGRAVTDAQGRFRMTGLRGLEVTVRVRRLGYRPLTQTVRVGTGDVRLVLEPSPIALEEVVVTAAGAQRLGEMGSSVARVRADSITRVAPISTFSQLLGARAAGVEVQNFSGTSVGRSEIRIRGAASASLSSAPVVYLDGVRVNADPSMPLSNNSNVPSRLNDLNPEEIESIDVLKGPSASTLYGTAAAHGVILITTKRGTNSGGPTPEWHFWTEAGRITEPNDYPANYGAFDDTGSPCLLTSVAEGLCTQAELRSFNLVEDPSTSFFNTGKRAVLGGSVAATTGAVDYFFSSEFETVDGVYDNDAVDKVNLRGNFTIEPTPAVNIQLNTGYVSSRLQLFREGGTVLGPLTNALLGGPEPDGWFAQTPEELAHIDHRQNVERFIGGTTVRLEPRRGVHIQGVFGLDATAADDQRLIPPGVLSGAREPGIVEAARHQRLKYTAELLARFDFALSGSITSRSAVGSQFFRDLAKQLISTGTVLAPGANSISTAGLVVTGEQTTDSRTLGLFVDQQFGYNDRLFLTGGLRADDNSNFGQGFDFIVYPNVNASWSLSQEPIFPTGNLVSSLRLRAAWGQSGSAPGPVDAVLFFGAFPSTTPEGDDEIGVSFDGGIAFEGAGGSLGNPTLKPERSSEIELGFDTGLLGDRVTLGLTYYNKVTSDALIFRPVAPSVGATSGRWENLAKIRNRGVEAVVEAGILERDNARLSVTANASYNQNRVLELGEGIAPIGVGGGQRHEEGFPLGGYWARTIESFQDSNGDGIIDPDEVTVTEDEVFLGDVFPPFQASIQPALTLFDRVQITGLGDLRTGHKLLNNTEDFRCRVGNSRARNDPATPLEEQARCIARSVLGATGAYVESADFARLRELSVTFLVPRSWAQALRVGGASVTVAGQNLAVWTGYSGIDPEPMIRRGFTVEVGRAEFSSSEFTNPTPTRTWILRVNVTF